MRNLYLLGFVTLSCLSTCFGTDLMVGTSFNAQLKWQTKVEYVGLLFQKRVKEVFYADPGQQVIKGVIAREADKTDATGIITAGGVGFSYVNIRFKSERSSGLYYQLEIYT